mmetsp:Transcript_40212/g.86219  ORF Transcript_40212/g.86219 Transcript_40212/m.86219 type:complete len:317 (+) Transcript_40212:1125-2075(+)
MATRGSYCRRGIARTSAKELSGRAAALGTADAHAAIRGRAAAAATASASLSAPTRATLCSATVWAATPTAAAAAILAAPIPAAPAPADSTTASSSAPASSADAASAAAAAATTYAADSEASISAPAPPFLPAPSDTSFTPASRRGDSCSHARHAVLRWGRSMPSENFAVAGVCALAATAWLPTTNHSILGSPPSAARAREPVGDDERQRRSLFSLGLRLPRRCQRHHPSPPAAVRRRRGRCENGTEGCCCPPSVESPRAQPGGLAERQRWCSCCEDVSERWHEHLHCGLGPLLLVPGREAGFVSEGTAAGPSPGAA